MSSFAQRHSAYHWYAGFDEAYNVGKFGLETADEVHAIASDWLARNGRSDDWFLHVHFWDPHTPYRAAASYGEPFASEPIPAWLTEEVRAAHWKGCGPHSARECSGYAPNDAMRTRFPRQPQQIDSMAAVRAMFDGYDLGVRVADEYVGRILNQLADLGVLDDTAIMVSSDHGETLGELNVYGDHQTADELVSHIPLILRWPGLGDAGRRAGCDAFHYQIDVTATILELLGQRVPSRWDGRELRAEPARGARRRARSPRRVAGRVDVSARRALRSVPLRLHLARRVSPVPPRDALRSPRAIPHEQHDLMAKPRGPRSTARGAAAALDRSGDAARRRTEGIRSCTCSRKAARSTRAGSSRSMRSACATTERAHLAERLLQPR